ncbi:MAG: hypothetical protein ACRCZI_05875 [Cetobacterium sp.]
MLTSRFGNELSVPVVAFYDDAGYLYGVECVRLSDKSTRRYLLRDLRHPDGIVGIIKMCEGVQEHRAAVERVDGRMVRNL